MGLVGIPPPNFRFKGSRRLVVAFRCLRWIVIRVKKNLLSWRVFEN